MTHISKTHHKNALLLQSTEEKFIPFSRTRENRLIQRRVCACWKVKKINTCVLYSWTKLLPYQLQKKLTKLKVSHEKSLTTLSSCVRKKYLKSEESQWRALNGRRQVASWDRCAWVARARAHILVKAKENTETLPELPGGMFTFTGSYRLLTEQTKAKRNKTSC